MSFSGLPDCLVDLGVNDVKKKKEEEEVQIISNVCFCFKANVPIRGLCKKVSLKVASMEPDFPVVSMILSNSS